MCDLYKIRESCENWEIFGILRHLTIFTHLIIKLWSEFIDIVSHVDK